MYLNKIDDPRDSLAKAKRRELIEFAHANGQMDITERMPAADYTDENGREHPGIRTILRQRGLTRISIPNRPLGKRGRHETRPLLPHKPTNAAPPDDEWAEFQKWKAARQQNESSSPHPSSAAPPAAEKPPRLMERPKQEINTLRDECKRLGIKMDRRDNKDALKAKIAAHGQDTPQRLQ